ncbi:MAG: hypothetical protein R2741_06680 [Methanolobus sp.]
MTFNALRPIASKVLEPMARTMADSGISPNAISMLSLLFAALAGFLYYYSDFSPLLVLIAGLLVALTHSLMQWTASWPAISILPAQGRFS